MALFLPAMCDTFLIIFREGQGGGAPKEASTDVRAFRLSELSKLYDSAPESQPNVETSGSMVRARFARKSSARTRR